MALAFLVRWVTLLSSKGKKSRPVIHESTALQTNVPDVVTGPANASSELIMKEVRGDGKAKEALACCFEVAYLLVDFVACSEYSQC